MPARGRLAKDPHPLRRVLRIRCASFSLRRLPYATGQTPRASPCASAASAGRLTRRCPRPRQCLCQPLFQAG
eukprot:scaffold38277_cov52-Phaeocystis_antarctica.AAC.2